MSLRSVLFSDVRSSLGLTASRRSSANEGLRRRRTFLIVGRLVD